MAAITFVIPMRKVSAKRFESGDGRENLALDF